MHLINPYIFGAGGGGGGGPFLQDTFTGTNGTLLTAHTPDIGGSWAVVPAYSAYASPNIDGNALVASDNNFSLWYNSVTPPSADYSVQADFGCRTNEGNGLWLILGRYNPSTNTGYYAYWHQDSAIIHMAKGDLAAGTNIGSGVSATVNTGVVKTVKLSMVGTTISLYVDGSFIESVTDSDYSAAGNVAISIKPQPSSSGNGMYFDNLLCQ